MDFGSIFQFLAPILQSILGSAASQGVNSLMAESPRQQRPQPAPAQQPMAPANVVGQGQTTAPSGLNFSGGFTGGGPIVGGQQGPPSAGFTTLGYPVTDQNKLKRAINDTGFNGI